MATSVAPAFKAALYGALVTAYANNTPPVQVCYGRPGLVPWADDVVALLEVDATQDTAALGNRNREERFNLTVLVSSYRGGGDEVAQATTEAAYALLATIETALRNDPDVADTCRVAQVVGHLLAEEAYAEGRVAEIAASIAVQARI